MVGVELAAPGTGSRWGRRVCAAAVRRGVLLRPLGDVVVLMPPLAITPRELRRLLTIVGDSIAEVVAAARSGSGEEPARLAA
jgi:adenosylmethionine-8-amino-7-oxononanoate aminotransferase